MTQPGKKQLDKVREVVPPRQGLVEALCARAGGAAAVGSGVFEPGDSA